MKEIKTTNVESIRLFCVKHELYTEGTVEEYHQLFDYIGYDYKVELSNSKIEKIATNIREHSKMGEFDYVDIINLMLCDNTIKVTFSETQKMRLSDNEVEELCSRKFRYYYNNYQKYVVFIFRDKVYSRRLHANGDEYFFNFFKHRINLDSNQLYI